MKKRTLHDRAQEAADLIAERLIAAFARRNDDTCNFSVRDCLAEAWRKGYDAAVRDQRKKGKG